MSRIGNKPIIIPEGITIRLDNNCVIVKSIKGELIRKIHEFINIEINNNQVIIKKKVNNKNSIIQSGTVRSLINNMIIGLSKGFEKKIMLVGVVYRAKNDLGKINLSLGYSHNIIHEVPKNITVEIPNTNEIILKSIDKELLGKVAAEIRSYRKPNIYSGKGLRYSDEKIITKETKKK